MFNKLTDFKLKRSRKQAIGFYLAYILFGMLLGGLLDGLAGMFMPDYTSEVGINIGTALSVIFSFILCSLIIKDKKLTDKLLFLLLPFLAGGLAFFGGGLLGFIIPAILTTHKIKK